MQRVCSTHERHLTTHNATHSSRGAQTHAVSVYDMRWVSSDQLVYPGGRAPPLRVLPEPAPRSAALRGKAEEHTHARSDAHSVFRHFTVRSMKWPDSCTDAARLQRFRCPPRSAVVMCRRIAPQLHRARKPRNPPCRKPTRFRVTQNCCRLIQVERLDARSTLDCLVFVVYPRPLPEAPRSRALV